MLSAKILRGSEDLLDGHVLLKHSFLAGKGFMQYECSQRHGQYCLFTCRIYSLLPMWNSYRALREVCVLCQPPSAAP